MGNGCCSGEANQHKELEQGYRMITEDNVQKESLTYQQRGRLRGMPNKQKVLEPQEHLPMPNSSDYIEYTLQFPPALTPSAQKCDSSLPKVQAPTPQSGDAIYPSSKKAYQIQATQSIYRGQFYNKKPHGFGEMYSPIQIANVPNSSLETMKKGNSPMIGENLTKGNATYSSEPDQLNQNSFVQYIGSFKNGLKHGYGREIYPDGSVYLGKWQNNLFHGNGKLKAVSENNQGKEEFYDGNWVEGQMHGFGIQQWKDGTLYKGKFEYGKKHGKGTFT